MGSCAWFLWKERCCLFQLERMGRTAASLLPAGSCRWSPYPFDLPFQSSVWGIFLGYFLKLVNLFSWLSAKFWSEINSWFWKFFRGHAVTLFFAGMKCAPVHWEDWIWGESCSIKIEYNLTDGEEAKRSKGEVKNASVCFKRIKLNQ